MIALSRDASELCAALLTSASMRPQRQKSAGLRSGLLGGHSLGATNGILFSESQAMVDREV